MKNFDKGVGWYTRATVEITFPEDDICCARCPLLGIEMASSRKYCRRTGEYLPAAEHFVGVNCPLQFNEEEEKCLEI